MLLKNYLQILLTSSLWGSSFLLMKFALEELDPFQISFYRILIGMIFINSLRIEKVKLSKKDHLYTALVGMLWMTLPFYLFAESEKLLLQVWQSGKWFDSIFISMFAVIFFVRNFNIKKLSFYWFLVFISLLLDSRLQTLN